MGHSLFTCDDNIEFSRQANSLAYQIIKSSCGEWIEEIYSIQKKKEILIIELRGCGISETLKIEIPNWHTE